MNSKYTSVDSSPPPPLPPPFPASPPIKVELLSIAF